MCKGIENRLESDQIGLEPAVPSSNLLELLSTGPVPSSRCGTTHLDRTGNIYNLLEKFQPKKMEYIFRKVKTIKSII